MADGIPQYALGVQTDCFIGYPKALAAASAIRTLSPKLLILDELSGYEELSAIKDSFYCGVQTAATVHASSLEELRRSRLGSQLLSSECFDYAVVLDGEIPGKIKEIKSLVGCKV